MRARRLLKVDQCFDNQQQDCARMFIALAYGFVGFTIALVLMLFWLAWEHRQLERSSRR